MIPFMFVAAARRQRNTNDIHSSNNSQQSFHSSNSSNSFHSSYSSHGAQNNDTSHNQAGGMPLGDLEAGHGQGTYQHYTPPPLYTGTPLPSTPPPSYHGIPLPCAPAPNTRRPYVNNHQIPRRPVPVPLPARRSRRRNCCSDPCNPRYDDCCLVITCILAFVFVMVVCPLLVIKAGKDGHHKGEGSRIHCRGAVGFVAPPAAYGGCG